MKIFKIMFFSAFFISTNALISQNNIASSNLRYNLQNVNLEKIETQKASNQDKSNLKLGTRVCINFEGSTVKGMVTGKDIIDKYFDPQKHSYTITIVESSNRNKKVKLKASEINYVGECVETYTEKPTSNLPTNLDIRKMELDIIKEVNIVRANPKEYAAELEKLTFNVFGPKNNSYKYVALGKGFLRVCDLVDQQCINDYMKKLQVAINYLKNVDGSLTILKENQKLNKASELLAADKGKINGPKHTDSQGRDPWARSKAVGYNGLRGECLNSGAISAAGFVINFLTSPGHRDILMKTDIDEIGVDIAYHENSGKPYLRDVIMVGKSENTSSNNTFSNNKDIITNNNNIEKTWYNFRYGKMDLKPGESLTKNQFLFSSNFKYLLCFNEKDIPVIGKVINTKRSQEDKLVQIEIVYTFPTKKASWLNTDECKLFIQKADGNLQYVNPNKQYWGLTDGRDKNKILLNRVNNLKITDDGRAILLDKNNNEIWTNYSN